MSRFLVVSAGSVALLALVSVGAGCAAEVGQGTESVGDISQAVSTTSFTSSYSSWSGGGFFGGGGSCSSTSYNSIKGYEPTAAGTYPVFVHVPGTQTSGAWDGTPDEDIIQYMASLGFVAADVDYPNTSYPTACSDMTGKAKCIYDSTSSNSAISKLCSRPKADCVNKGIYVSGISQGANISSQAANYAAHAKAAYLIANGDNAEGFINLSGCLDKSHLTFTSSQLREVNGEADQYFGSNQAGVQTQLQNVSGKTCAAGTYNCLSADGSGWQIVKNSQTVDGTADHCYFLNGASSDCSSFNGMDANWDTGSDTWEKIKDFAWLTTK